MEKNNIQRDQIKTAYQSSKSRNVGSTQKFPDDDTDFKTSKTTTPSQKNEDNIPSISFGDYFLQVQSLDFFIPNREVTKEQEKAVEDNLIKYQQQLDLYRKKKEIEKMKERIKILEDKNNKFKDIKVRLESLIHNKENHLKVATSSHEITKNNYITHKEKHDKNANKIIKYKIIYDSLVYKKIMEISYIFFNNKIENLFINCNVEKIRAAQKRYEAYSSDPKAYGSLMGNIAFLLSYFSRTFNITLRFPIFLKGSKSYCVVNKSDFVALFSDPKNDDRFIQFEKGMNFQKDNLREIFFFLSQFGNMLPPDNLETIDLNYQRILLFDLFIEFNQVLFHFIEKTCKEDEYFRN